MRFGSAAPSTPISDSRSLAQFGLSLHKYSTEAGEENDIPALDFDLAIAPAHRAQVTAQQSSRNTWALILVQT